MKRIRLTTIVKLSLSVLALVAAAHLPLVIPARAGILENDLGATCNGTGVWHFVENQVGVVLPPDDHSNLQLRHADGDRIQG